MLANIQHVCEMHEEWLAEELTDWLDWPNNRHIDWMADWLANE